MHTRRRIGEVRRHHFTCDISPIHHSSHSDFLTCTFVAFTTTVPNGRVSHKKVLRTDSLPKAVELATTVRASFVLKHLCTFLMTLPTFQPVVDIDIRSALVALQPP
jgi:hypothetical protein